MILRMVRVARFELTASWSRTMRATNCATPGYVITCSASQNSNIISVFFPSVKSENQIFYKSGAPSGAPLVSF